MLFMDERDGRVRADAYAKLDLEPPEWSALA
jgi:hypothetical protein